MRDSAECLVALDFFAERWCGITMNTTITFGQWLKQRRKVLGLTQNELAQQAGCAEVTLRKIEASGLHPSAPLVASLARALGVAEADRPGLVALARGADDDFTARPRLLRPQRPNNLPAQLTPLIGREQDIAAVGRRLLTDGARLITLVGPPGVGKTRLALAVAEDVLEQFEHGAFFVRLGPISDPALVASAIAQALGKEMSGANPPALQLRAWLEEKHLLLVLDNFEHLVAAAPLVDDLLRRCPWLHVLVTSRQPLRVRGERQVPVQPLTSPSALPGADQTTTAADVLRYPAVALFAERAEAVQPDFAVDDGNALAVAEICRRLDGLPLAIELVAARIKLLPPAELLLRLHGLWLLSADGLRDVSARQKTLRGAIGWSFDLLTPMEQTLFTSLALFVGGCTLEAAEMLCEDMLSPAQVLDGIASLLDKSLLRSEVDPHNQSRYTMLETVREYALERLAAGWEKATICERHATYFLKLAEESASHLRTQEQLEWIDRLNLEQNNIRAALSRSLECGWGEIAFRLTSALSYYWHLRGFETEGRQWIRLTMSLAETDPTLRDSFWYTRTVLGYAVLLIWDSDSATRSTLLQEALSNFERHHDVWGIGYSLQNLARLAYEQGKYAEARSLAERGLVGWQITSDAWGMSVCHHTLALIAYQQADWPAWRMHLHEAATLARIAGDRWLLAPTLQYLGLDIWQRAGARLGRPVLEESLAAFREIGNQVMVAALLNKLGEVMRDQGDYAVAQESCSEALEIIRAWPDYWEIAWTLYCLGSIAFRSGDLVRARQRFEECLNSFRNFDHDAYRWLEGFVLSHRGHLALHEGNLAQSAEDLERSWHLLVGRQETIDLSQTAFVLGELARLQSQWSQALLNYRYSLAKLCEVGRAVNTPDCLEGFAKVFTMQGQPEHAARLFGCAEGLRQQLDTPVPLIERRGYERCVSATRQQLDDAHFAELWSDGRAMTLEHVVTYAMQLTDESYGVER